MIARNIPAQAGAYSLHNKARILLPRFDTFGDIVIFEAFLEGLRKTYPFIKLTILVREGYDDLAPLFPSELQLHWLTVSQPAYVRPTEQQRAEFVHALRKYSSEEWDAILITTFNRTWLDDLLLDEFIRKRSFIIGSESDFHCLSTKTHVVVPADEWSHEMDKYRVLLEALTGETTPLPPPRLTVPPPLAEEAAQELTRLGLAPKLFVACLPAGTQNQRGKVWPIDRYAEVLAWLTNHHGLPPLLVGHTQEETSVRALAEMLAIRGVEAQVWLGQNGGIPMLGALLQQSSFYLGNDSGPMHIADALGVPVIGVFGGGTFPRFVPSGRRSMAIVSEQPCFGCYWQCLFGDTPCMRLVNVESVKTAIELMINNQAPDTRILNTNVQLPPELFEIAKGAKRPGLCQCKQVIRNESISEDMALTSLLKLCGRQMTSQIRRFLGRM